MGGGRNHSPLISREIRDLFLALKNGLSELFIEVIIRMKSELARNHQDPEECNNLDLSDLIPSSFRSTDVEILQDDEKTLGWFCETVGYVARNVAKREGGPETRALLEKLLDLNNLMKHALTSNGIEIPRQSFEGLERKLNDLVRDFLGEGDKENRQDARAVSDDVIYAVRNYVIVERAKSWQEGFFSKDLPALCS